jgi:L-iditol 2-dehydrogenase
LLVLRGMNVLATDLFASRLRLAKSLGAKSTFQVQPPNAGGGGSKSGVGPTLAEFVEKATAGKGLDAAVIAVPSDAVVRESQALVRGAGQVLLFSHTKRGDTAALDLAEICVDEKDLIGSYSADLPCSRRWRAWFFRANWTLANSLRINFLWSRPPRQSSKPRTPLKLR